MRLSSSASHQRRRPITSDAGTAAQMMSVDGETPVLRSVQASGKVSGLLFELEVAQHYVNDSSRNAEVVYTFPLPTGAVLLGLELQIGERRLEGVVARKQAAVAQYEDDIANGDSAALLEEAGDGLYTISLGNLLAGEAAVVRLRWAQLLRREDDGLRLAIPTVIAPRYGDQAAAGLAPHQQVESDLLAEYPFTLQILLEGAVGEGMVSCPTHAISTGRRPDGLLVRLDEGGCLDRDFVLRVDGLGAMPLSSTARDGNGFVTLASFAPPPPVKAVGAPLALHLLVDCSGSMAGESIDSARRALDLLANALGERDRVTLTCFGSSISPRIERPLGMAGRAELREAIAAIDADMGGTEMEGALLHVLGLAREHGGDVLVLTDGEVWQGEEVINTAVRGGQRVFTIGVGMSPSEGLLVRLAQATGGEATFVTPGEAVVEAVRRTMSRLMQPAATDVAITWPGPVEWTTRLPRAVFAGETTHVFARSAEPLVGQAVLSWTGDGERQQTEVLLASSAVGVELDAPDLAALPRIAAFHRLSELDDEAAGAMAESYGLVTSATSMVLSLKRSAEEKATEQPELRKAAQMLAAGHAGMGVSHSVSSELRMRISDPMVMSEFSASSPGPVSSANYDSQYSAPKMSRPRNLREFFGKIKVGDKISFERERPAPVTPMTSALEEIGLSRLPTRLEELFAYGNISDDVRSLLEARLAQGVDEHALVLAFVAALLKASPNRRQLRSEILTLRTRVEKITGGTSPDDILGPDLVAAAGKTVRA